MQVVTATGFHIGRRKRTHRADQPRHELARGEIGAKLGEGKFHLNYENRPRVTFDKTLFKLQANCQINSTGNVNRRMRIECATVTRSCRPQSLPEQSTLRNGYAMDWATAAIPMTHSIG